MRNLTFMRRFFGSLIFIVFVILVVSVWLYFKDLRRRFPDIDFSLAHFGIASWYSETDPAINLKTASGETFDDKAMTCASWHYPFQSELLVINLMNARWTVCRVNDRGPAKRLHREIDLTKRSFQKIAHSHKGLIYVAVIPIEPGRLPKGHPRSRK